LRREFGHFCEGLCGAETQKRDRFLLGEWGLLVRRGPGTGCFPIDFWRF